MYVLLLSYIPFLLFDAYLDLLIHIFISVLLLFPFSTSECILLYSYK
jgi:hypothetical protein